MIKPPNEEITGALLLMLQEQGYSAAIYSNGWQIVVESSNQCGPWVIHYSETTGNVKVRPHPTSRVEEDETFFILSDPQCFNKICTHLRERGLEPIQCV